MMIQKFVDTWSWLMIPLDFGWLRSSWVACHTYLSVMLFHVFSELARDDIPVAMDLNYLNQDTTSYPFISVAFSMSDDWRVDVLQRISEANKCILRIWALILLLISLPCFPGERLPDRRSQAHADATKYTRSQWIKLSFNPGYLSRRRVPVLPLHSVHTLAFVLGSHPC